MYERLKIKIESTFDKYIDLVDKRIETALKDELVDGAAINEIANEIRTLNHAAATLERFDRMNRGNDSCGQSSETD